MGDWHTKSIPEILAELGTDFDKGLSADEAKRRLENFGKNQIRERAGASPGRILLAQFTSVMVLMLFAAGVVSLFLREVVDALAIFAILLLNAALGFFQELRAERALQALKRLAVPRARVCRAGQVVEVAAQELVPGDIVLLEAGAHIPADGRLLEAVALRVQEAALTGESEPVDKDAAERSLKNTVYMGTAAVAGRGRMVVTETGMATELGKIAALLGATKREPTPLQKRLERMARELAWAVLVLTGLVFLLGVLRGGEYREMFLIAVAIAVAAVPEGLPAVVTIALALGARRMLRRNALVRRLNAVETLGSVTVICSDKTGTLTQNRMTVTVLDVAGERCDLAVVRAKGEKGRTGCPEGSPGVLLLGALGALCNDALFTFQPKHGVKGDPTEGALVLAAQELGFDLERLIRFLPRCGEVPFSPVRKRMSTVHQVAGMPETEAERTLAAIFGIFESRRFLFTKGAVEGLLERCDRVFFDNRVEPLTAEWRRRVLHALEEFTGKGMRVLGCAFRPLSEDETGNEGETLENRLVFVGMSAMVDPARPEVQEAVRTCRQAGIRPVMITGDHPLTAQFIALEIGIVSPDEPQMEKRCITGAELAQMGAESLKARVKEVAVYARVSPADKLKIVEALQAAGEVVAMTGDGVNDAPALKKADIGVAMGVTGTDVAKEAADMVLLDDNFATIVAAVREGRTIYENIRKFIRYTLASNAGEILTMFAAPFCGMPFPLNALQILWVNLVTDGLPGLALALEPPEPDVMRRPPRRLHEGVFARGMGFNIIWSGLLLGAVATVLGYWAFRRGEAGWRTMVFTTLVVGQLCHSLSLRSQRASFFRLKVFDNPALIGTFLLTLFLQLLVVYLPPLQRVFHTRSLSPGALGICLLASTVVFWAVELEKMVRRMRGSGG